MTSLTIAAWMLAAAQTPADAEAKISAGFQALETKLYAAIKAKDNAAVQSLLATEFAYIVAVSEGAPRVMNRSEWLQTTTSLITVENFEVRHLSARTIDDVVLVNFQLVRAAAHGTRDISGHTIVTDVWVKRSGDWKLAARYASQPQALAPPSAR